MFKTTRKFAESEVSECLKVVKEDMENETNCTSYGEPQSYICLCNGRVLEITKEMEMLPSEQYFYSCRVYYNPDDPEENEQDYFGYLDTFCSASLSEEDLKEVIRLGLISGYTK